MASQSDIFGYDSALNRYWPSSFNIRYNNPSDAPQISHHQTNIIFPVPLAVSIDSVIVPVSVPSVQNIFGENVHAPVPATHVQVMSLDSSAVDRQTEDYSALTGFFALTDKPADDITEVGNQSVTRPFIRQRLINIIREKKEQSIEEADSYLKRLVQYTNLVSPDLSSELFEILYPRVPDVKPTTPRVPSSSSTTLLPVGNQGDRVNTLVVEHQSNDDGTFYEEVNDNNVPRYDLSADAFELPGVPQSLYTDLGEYILE